MHFFLKEEYIASFFAAVQCIAYKTIQNYLYIRKKNRNYRQNSQSRRAGRLKGKEKVSKGMLRLPKIHAAGNLISRYWNF